MKKANSILITGILSVLLSLVPSMRLSAAYQEAPMLKKLVQAGKLPPIAERLPDEPMIVSPYDQIGTYGGRMQILTGMPQFLVDASHLLFEPLLRFAADGTTIVPNVAKSWQMSADGKSCTIYLHKGMRWSDGVPVTVDDVLFAWEDVLLNKDLTPIMPPILQPGGKPMKIERVDDYTFRLIFEESYGALPYFLTRTINDPSLVIPKHYLKNYHPKYTPIEKIMEITRQRGFEHWFQLFKDVNHTVRRLSDQMPADYPVLSPWHVVESPAIGHAILERNPYYWKIDPQGNQLPYIDSIHSVYIGNPEARNLKLASGEIDFGGASYARLENTPLFLSGRKNGNYDVYFWKENQGTRVAFYFNQTHEDPELRKVFQDKRFRIALSHAINRQEINEVLYFGKCMPRQNTVNRVCSYFESEFETAYIDYDPDKAQRILDEMGLKRKGKGGWRKLPNGKTLVITLDVPPSEPYMKTTELVKEYWQAIGVLLNYRIVQSELLNRRMEGNKHDVMVYPNDTATDIMVMSAPMLGIDYWGRLWYLWYMTQGNDQKGEEPPQHIKDLYETWMQMRRTVDTQERIRLGKKIVRAQAENLWSIGTVGETITPIIVSNRLGNVPKWMLDENGKPIEGTPALNGWPWLESFLHHPEQWFIRQSKE